MKRITIVSIVTCAFAVACAQRQDDSEFIRDMYENVRYEDYGFLKKHCASSLLKKLSDAYDYDGDGYAVWLFRSGAQDGPGDEHSVNDYRLITPIPSEFDVDNLKDCTIPAKFTADDFKWMGGNLRMTVYSKDLYDAVDISQMQMGDTLLYAGKPMVVETIEEVNGGLVVNGDIENGGCCLAGYEGGTYVAREWDDHPTYTELGKAEVALAEDFVIIDCGDFPTDPLDSIRTGQKLYLESLKSSHREFYPLNTLVTIENGAITEINRRWIP